MLPAFELPSMMTDPRNALSANPFADTALGLYMNLDLYTDQDIEEYAGEKNYYDVGGMKIEIPEKLRFAVSNLSRLYGTLEKQKWLQFALPINIEQINYGRTVYFDKRDTENAIRKFEDGLTTYAIRTKSPEELERIRQNLIKLYSTNIQQLLTMYKVNEDFDGNPLPYYTTKSGVTDQFDVINDASDRLLSAIEHTRNTVTFPDEDKAELMSVFWATWAEVEAKKINHLIVGATTSTTDLARMRFYNRALSEIDQAVKVEGLGPHSYIAFRNEFSEVLDRMIADGMIPESYKRRPRAYKRYRMDLFTERNAYMEAFAEDMINSEL
jgi:hypothetical protein